VLEKRQCWRGYGSGYDVVPVFIARRVGNLKVAERDLYCARLQSSVVREGDELEFDVEAVPDRTPLRRRPKQDYRHLGGRK